MQTLTKAPFRRASAPAQWKQTRKHGIILQNKKMGIDVFHYSIVDDKNRFLYDTIGISEPIGGCLIVIVDQNGALGLIKEYRPIPDKVFISCVRGFNEGKLPPEELVKKEVYEETSIDTVSSVTELGLVYQNTTYFINPLTVYLACVDVHNTKTDLGEHDSARAEGISSITFYAQNDIRSMIARNEIQCQMTLSALMLYFARLTDLPTKMP